MADLLTAHPAKLFADAPAWAAHLASLGIDRLAATPDSVRLATEGALWGAIHRHGLLAGTVIVSDGAGQFRVGLHALCWVHAEQLVHTLVPATPVQRRAIELVRTLIWWFYADLKAWTRDPCPRSLPTTGRSPARPLRAHLRATDRLRDAGSAPRPPAPAQGGTAARAPAS